MAYFTDVTKDVFTSKIGSNVLIFNELAIR